MDVYIFICTNRLDRTTVSLPNTYQWKDQAAWVSSRLRWWFCLWWPQWSESHQGGRAGCLQRSEVKINNSKRVWATGLVNWPTCDVEVRVAGGFAHFVGDDALVDASVHVAHGTDDQAVHVTDCGRKQQRKKRMKRLDLKWRMDQKWLLVCFTLTERDQQCKIVASLWKVAIICPVGTIVGLMYY